MNVPVWPTRPPQARESRFGYVDLRDLLDHRAPLVSTGSTTRGCAGSTGPRSDRPNGGASLSRSLRGSVELVDERTRSPDTPAVGPRITIRVRRFTRQAQPPRTRGLDRLDHPRLRGLDRSSVRPALRVIELVEITARESVQLVDERTRSPDTPAVGPRITIRVRRSTRRAQPPRTRGLDRLDHPDPWSRQARPAEVARARPVLDATGPSGDRACRDHCARVRRARR